MNMIGIYYPEHSFWHKIDPRSKMVVVLTIMLLLMTSRGGGLVLLCLLTVGLYLTSKLPWRLGWEVLSKFKWLLLIPFLVNLGFPFQNSFSLTIRNNFSGALIILLRLAVMLVVATWLSYVTKPMTLVEGITRLIRPWERLVKNLDLPLMMGLVVRFIPELFHESENILVAQKIRGINPGFNLRNSPGWIKSTIIPIFLAGIRKASALAVAMEARGYRPGIRRSPILQLKLSVSDYILIGLSILVILCMALRLFCTS